MASGTTTTQILSGNVGTLIMSGCRINDTLVDTGGASSVSYNTQFTALTGSSSAGVGIFRRFFGCSSTGNVSFGPLVTFVWVGGEIGTAGGATLTISGANTFGVVQAGVTADLTIGASTAGGVVVNNTGAVGGNVSVTATIPNVSVTGEWAGVSFTGVPTALRRFDGSGDSLDFTGPGQVSYLNKTGGAGHNIKLRGTGVLAVCQITLGVALQGLSLIDSLIMADFAVASTFLLDASSTRCIAILSGTGQAGWGGTTNSGTNNRIITEFSDTLISSPPAGALSPNILPAEIAAIGTGVQTFPPVTSSGATAAQLDAIRKDLVMADLVGPASGVQTYPAVTSSGSGATVAQLDAIRKDLVMGDLVGPQAQSGIAVYPTDANVTQDAAKDFNRNFMI